MSIFIIDKGLIQNSCLWVGLGLDFLVYRSRLFCVNIVCVVLYLSMSMCECVIDLGSEIWIMSDIVTLVHWVRWSGDTIRGPGSWTLVVSRVWESHGPSVLYCHVCCDSLGLASLYCHTLPPFQVVSPHCQTAK